MFCLIVDLIHFRLKHANKDIIVVRIKVASESDKHRDDLLETIRMLKARSRLGVVQEMKQTRVKVSCSL